MEGQRDKARAGSAFGGGRKGDGLRPAEARPPPSCRVPAISFEGYTTTRVSGVPILALFDEDRQAVDQLDSGQAGYVALARTPFYLEAGGQVSDTGRIFNEATGASAAVDGLVRIRPGLPRAHTVHVTAGALRVARHRHGRSGRSGARTRRGAITRRRTCSTRRCARCSAAT